MSIAFVAGTTAEIIKLAPVMQELRDRGISYHLWSTDQHVSGMREKDETRTLSEEIAILNERVARIERQLSAEDEPTRD